MGREVLCAILASRARTASPGAVAPRMFEAAASAAEFGAPRRRARAKGSLSAGQAAAYERTGAYRHAPKPHHIERGAYRHAPDWRSYKA